MLSPGPSFSSGGETKTDNVEHREADQKGDRSGRRFQSGLKVTTGTPRMGVRPYGDS